MWLCLAENTRKYGVNEIPNVPFTSSCVSSLVLKRLSNCSPLPPSPVVLALKENVHSLASSRLFHTGGEHSSRRLFNLFYVAVSSHLQYAADALQLNCVWLHKAGTLGRTRLMLLFINRTPLKGSFTAPLQDTDPSLFWSEHLDINKSRLVSSDFL